MFPTGRPGVGLLLVRVSLGVLLIHGVAGRTAELGSVWFLVLAAALAVILCLGLLTPPVTALCIALELMTFYTAGASLETVNVCAIIDSIAVALLGPGGYSLDAKLFGRRQVVLPMVEGG